MSLIIKAEIRGFINSHGWVSSLSDFAVTIDNICVSKALTGFFGQKVNVRYWIGDKEATKEEAITNFLETLYDGDLDGLSEMQPWSYSEYTCGEDFHEHLWIGGHNLLAELSNANGKYVILEVEITE